MKKSIFFLLAACCALGFFSCNKTDNQPAMWQGLVTVHQRAIANDYYFETDARKTIYPSDKSRIADYVPQEGQRAFIFFSLLDEKIENYDYNAVMYSIVDIYTSEASIIADKEELDELPDDPIMVNRGWMEGDWLTLIVYPITDYKQHTFHLFIDDANPKNTEHDFVDMELRHDRGSDTKDTYYGDYISFNLQAIRSRFEGKKGITLWFKNEVGQRESIQLKRGAE